MPRRPTLDDDAVLELVDESFDFERSYFGAREVEWRCSVERLDGTGQPVCGFRAIAVEQGECAADDPGCAKEPIRFLGLKPPFAFPPRQRPGWDVDQGRRVRRRQRQIG